MKNYIIIGLGLVVAIVGGYFIFSAEEEPETTKQSATTVAAPSSTALDQLVAGETGDTPSVYEEYTPAKLAASETEVNLLFFHANWCVICNSIKSNIGQTGLPDNVSIFEVNYDSATDLKEKYGITYQSAFVQVDSQGNEIHKWQGLFDDGIEEILAQVKTT